MDTGILLFIWMNTNRGKMEKIVSEAMIIIDNNTMIIIAHHRQKFRDQN